MHVLAIGAHPDDIELGAAALVSSLTELGHRVSFLVMTDDGDLALRREEARRSAEALGVPEKDLHFAGYQDGHLRADGETVGQLRELMDRVGVTPDLVVVHTAADSHNDHVEANRIAHAVFRKSVFLQYPIHLSCESSLFAPRLYIGVTGRRADRKADALAAHSSQAERINRFSLEEFEGASGRHGGLPRAEAYEVGFQAGVPEDLLRQVFGMNESAFHAFWHQIIGTKPLALFYESYERAGASIDWPTEHESVGRDTLRAAFLDHWGPRTPMKESPSSGFDLARTLVAPRHILLTGGAVGNRITRDVYNRMESVRWVMEYDLPRAKPAYLLDRFTGARFRSEFDAHGQPEREFVLLARKVNPYAEGFSILCAAGTSGRGTRIALEALARPQSHPAITEPLLSERNAEVAFSVQLATQSVEILAVHG